MPANKRIYAYAAIAVGVLLIGALAVVFGLRAARLDPPAQAVQSLLELRSANSTDTKAYERYVESTSVASALAEDSAGRKSGTSPIPPWQRPRVSKETTSGTEVVVTWRASDKFKGWPTSTTFMVRLRDGRWVVVDAEESQSKASGETSSTPAGSK